MSAAHDSPITKFYLAPGVLFIAYSTIFKLSMMVSTGQTKQPSDENFKAASPPFPETIDFLTACNMFAAINGSLALWLMIIYLNTLHLEPITLPPCKQLTINGTHSILFFFGFSIFSPIIWYKGFARIYDWILGRVKLERLTWYKPKKLFYL